MRSTLISSSLASLIVLGSHGGICATVPIASAPAATAPAPAPTVPSRYRNDIPAAVVETLKPQNYAELGAQGVKIKYGPFLVPGIADPETMGMKNFMFGPAKMPCGDCFITGFNANLELADGTEANANTGMWLHHTVFLNEARKDNACPRMHDRWIGAGNERTRMDFTLGGTKKAGYLLEKEPVMTSNTELMNESQEAREAYLLIDWEFVPASTPGFKGVTPIWMDVTGVCTNSSLAVTAESGVFEKALAPEWTSDVAGEVITNFGHLHDGGTHLEVTVNGKLFCDHVAAYGEEPEFITHVGMFGQEHGHEEGEEEHEHAEGEEEHEHAEGEEEHEHGDDAGHAHTRRHDPDEGGEPHEHPGEHDHSTGEHIAHISSITQCNAAGRFEIGDKVGIKAYYDLTTHTAMPGHHGGLEPVMGISLLYLVKD